MDSDQSTRNLPSTQLNYDWGPPPAYPGKPTLVHVQSFSTYLQTQYKQGELNLRYLKSASVLVRSVLIVNIVPFIVMREKFFF